MAFSNWPTTDPMDYPEEINQLFMKCAQVDVEHIASTDKFLSGQFASYHVYSYYPDYLSHYDSWKEEIPYAKDYLQEDGSYNTYGIYLEMLNRHHTMPVVISEFWRAHVKRQGHSFDFFTQPVSQGIYVGERAGEMPWCPAMRTSKRRGARGVLSSPGRMSGSREPGIPWQM